jgi:polyisoprenoid-binding protein YceI
MNKEADVATKTTWKFDLSHSEVVFHATHLIITDVRGHFRTFDGNIYSENDDFSDAEVEFSADVASIDTNNKDRDNHLRSEDFFNAEKYPTLNFRGNLVKNGEKYALNGDLTIRDTTKPVSLDVVYRGHVKDPFSGMEKAGFKIVGKINRFDYNLKWNMLMEAGGAIVGPEIRIECNVELQKQS